jgi:hypothetical protein
MERGKEKGRRIAGNYYDLMTPMNFQVEIAP